MADMMIKIHNYKPNYAVNAKFVDYEGNDFTLEMLRMNGSLYELVLTRATLLLNRRANKISNRHKYLNKGIL